MPRLPTFEEWETQKASVLPTFDEWEGTQPEAPSFEKKFKLFEESLTKGREMLTRSMEPEEFATGSKLADDALSFLSNIPRNILGIANLPFEVRDAFYNVIEGKRPAGETAEELGYGFVQPLENLGHFINPIDVSTGKIKTSHQQYREWENLRESPMGPVFALAIAYGGAKGFGKVKGKVGAKFDAWRENIPKKIIQEAQKEFVAPKEEVFKKAPEVAERPLQPEPRPPMAEVPKPKPPRAAERVGKEPYLEPAVETAYQYTLNEYMSRGKGIIEQDAANLYGAGSEGWIKAVAEGKNRRREMHRRGVENAVRTGKPVPPEVLADYPDLAGKVKKPVGDKGQSWIEVGYTKPTARSMAILRDAVEYAEGHPGTGGLYPWSVRLTKEATRKLAPEPTYNAVKTGETQLGVKPSSFDALRKQGYEIEKLPVEQIIITNVKELHQLAKQWESIKKPVPGEEALRVQREMKGKLKDVRAKQGAEWAEKQRQAEEGGFLRLGREKELPYEVEDIKSPTPEVESFFKRTEKPSLFEKTTTVAGAIKGRIRGAVITFEHLKRKGVRKFYADAVEDLSVLKNVNRGAIAEATADLQGIVQDVSKKQMKLLSRKVFVDDLLWTAEQGKKVPEGLDINNLTLERGRLETLIAQDPDVLAGIGRYREYSNAIRNDLIKRGKLTDDTAVNPFYVHHEILDYARARGHRGFFGAKVQAPKRGYTRVRLGSVRDIYTDWLGVNFKHFAQVLRDNMIEDGLVKIANRYDITPKLKQARLKRRVKEGYLPDGYVQYSVRRGTLQGVPPKPLVEAKIYEMMDAIASDARTLEVIREAKGLDGRQVFVIPRELADALDSFRIYEPKSLVNQAVRQWKRIILNVNPVRYNRRNFVGDLERLVVTDPGALPLAGEDALRDIVAAGRGHFTEDFRLAQERGVVGSGRFRIEAERPTRLPEFKHLAEERNIFQKGYGAYDLLWQKLQKVTGAREDFLRLTQFYANLKRLRSGKPINTCISKVEGITDPVKACGKIAREALIDYGDFTSWEEALRNGVIPFYSWLKGNTTFWAKTFTQQGFTKRGVKILGAKVTRTGIKGIVAGVGLMEVTAIAWNNLQHPEQEERLPDWQRNRWHLNTGRQTDDGEEIVISDPTALTDFLETVGLEQAIPDIIGVCRGQKDLSEVAKATAWKVAKAPIEALAMKAGPTFQLPYTFFSKKKLFPEPLQGRFVGKGQMPATLFGQLFGPEPKLAWDILAGRREIQELPYKYMPFPIHEVADYGEKKELFPRLRGTP